MDEAIAELALDYRRHLEPWAELNDAGQSTARNCPVDQAHTVAKRLRVTGAGQAALEALLEHSDPEIRCWVAVEVIPFNPDRAYVVLREIRDSRGPGSFNAQATLEVFEAGELNSDW